MKNLFLFLIVLLIIQSTGCSDKKTDTTVITNTVVSKLNSPNGSDFLNVYFQDTSKVKVVGVDTITSIIEKGDTVLLNGVVTLSKTVFPNFSTKVLKNSVFLPYEENVKKKFEATVAGKDSSFNLLQFKLDLPVLASRFNYTDRVEKFFKENKIKSVKKIPELIAKSKQEFTKATQQEKDHLFCLIHQRMKELAKPYEFDSRFDDSGWDRFESNTKYGYAIGGEEGLAWLEVDYGYMEREFKNFISDDLMIFVHVFKLEQQNSYFGRDVYYSDLISSEERLARLIQIENYFKRNDQPLIQVQIEDLFANLFIRFFRLYYPSAFGTGIDDVKGKSIGELKTVFANAEKKYPDTFTGAFAKDFNKVLAQNNYIVTDEVINYLAPKNFVDPSFR